MEKYTKLFIKSSIYYLIFGTLIGVLMGTQFIFGMSFKFIHIHLNLLGFMTMMIMGVAYHILPRFNAKPLKYPNWVPIQFYLHNIGLIGLIVFYSLGGYWETAPGIKSILLALFSIVAGISIIMFAINILSVLAEPEKSIESAPPSSIPVDKENKIPSSVPSSVPSSAPISKSGFKIPQAPPAPGIGSGKGITKGEKCDKDVMIGNLLETYPETKKVFAKHYGEACFTCPGQAYETVDQTASMHSIDVNIILNEINDEIEKALKGS